MRPLELLRRMRSRPVIRLLACTLLVGAACTSLSSQQPEWQPVPELTERGGALAYDAVRERVVLFGGITGSYSADCRLLDDTWEWDGHTWERRDPKHRPPARGLHAMAFDWVRGRVLLFGGYDNTVVFNDTWEWDGRDWHQVLAAQNPPARAHHQMASDPARGRIVLFGGYVQGWTVNDTWEWDGQSWQQQFPRTLPDPRAAHGMAFNGLTRRVAITGGVGDRLPLDTVLVWEWDGNDWTRIHGGVSPGKLNGVAAAFDPGSGGMLMYNARWTIPPVNETWRWDGVRWKLLDTPAAPPPRGPVLVADLKRREVVLYGTTHEFRAGVRPPGRDTWVFDAQGRWRLVDVIPKPTGAYYEGVYDSARNQLLLVGLSAVVSREAMFPANGDMGTWAHWSSIGFRRVLTFGAVPPDRLFFGIAYHPPSRLVVLYGDDTPPLWVGDDRTWLFDGTRWRGVLYDPRPDRFSVRMAYDTRSQQVLAYSPNQKELWAWDPTGWKLLASANSALPGKADAVAFDAARQRLVIHGADAGNPTAPDTWEWDGSGWRRMTPVTPTTRLHGRMAYFPELGGCVLVGANKGEAAEETWLWDGVGWSQAQVASMSTCGGLDPVRTLAYDPSRQRLVATHHVNDSNTLPNSVWELRISSLSVDEPFPRIGETITFRLSMPRQASRSWLLGLALSDLYGIPLLPSPVYGMQILPLDRDALLEASLAAALGGVLDPAGQGTVALKIPALPSLTGFRFHAAAFTWSPATGSVGAISHGLEVQVVR